DDDREVALDVHVVWRDDDRRLGRGRVEAASQLLHRRPQLGSLVHVAVRRDRGEADHGRLAIRSTRSSRNRGASTSTPTCPLGARPVTSQRSTTVRPSQYVDAVSTSTLQCNVVTSVGSITCATAIASWIGEPSKR